ncbi:hypothetical protein A6U87_00045 [Rhizobium sp. AC44/96]|nr:hypothetical protein A6U87_00045 [Rhizobium sp. AC44/96]
MVTVSLFILFDGRNDLPHYRFDRLMLPESKNCPADLGKVLAHPSVTRAVAFDLLHPEGGVLLHRWRMDIAPVPEAAIEKDGDS